MPLRLDDLAIRTCHFPRWLEPFRAVLELHPKLEIPNWARRELSRLIPELSDEPLPPISSMDDRLRLFKAAECVYQALRQQSIFTLTDDTQFFDDSSLELVEYLTASNPSNSALRSISAFRPAEVSEKFNQTLRQMVDRWTGGADRIKTARVAQHC